MHRKKIIKSKKGLKGGYHNIFSFCLSLQHHRTSFYFFIWNLKTNSEFDKMCPRRVKPSVWGYARQTRLEHILTKPYTMV